MVKTEPKKGSGLLSRIFGMRLARQGRGTNRRQCPKVVLFRERIVPTTIS
jgi:hypothetical protein